MEVPEVAVQVERLHLAHGPGSVQEDAMSEPQGSENTRKLPVLEKSDDPGALGQSASAAAYEPLETLDDKDSRQGRFWSARRVPACVLAILLFVIAGFFLYDVAAVRAGRSALELRKWFARQLAERPLDDTAVLVGAGVAAALGLWLILLAATPDCATCCPCGAPTATCGPGCTGEPPRWPCATAPWRSPASSRSGSA